MNQISQNRAYQGVVIRRGQLEVPEHVELHTRFLGIRDLICRLRSARSHQLRRLERLELYGTRASIRRGIDELHRTLERPVVIHAGFRNDEDGIRHA